MNTAHLGRPIIKVQVHESVAPEIGDGGNSLGRFPSGAALAWLSCGLHQPPVARNTSAFDTLDLSNVCF